MEHFILLGYSILVADHEPRIADNLQKMLEGAGAYVLRARSAEEALHCAEQVELFAAVLDYGRSINNDHPIARRLTALGIPFVFCKEISRNDAWPLEAVVSKPVSGTDLVETLRRLLQPESSKETVDGLKLLAGADRLGLEGIVSKRADAPYRSGKRSEWIKML